MGAFGNYNHTQTKYQIDFTRNKPIEVCATFNTIGKIRPDYIRYKDNNHEYFTFKIDAVKYIREYDNRTLFCCIITNYGRQIEVLLSFHIMQCLWTIPL